MSSSNERGPISWMARNPVAANLLMALVLVGGLISLLTMKQEIFPSFDLDVVAVSVPYPGASPTEVEQGISLVVEEAVRGIDGVKRVTSTSSEGVGVVSVELLIDADPDKVLADVKGAVDRILTFPDDAEKATVALLTRRQRVVSLILAGDQDLRQLHALAERVRDELLRVEDISQVEVFGVPPLEVSIEIPRETLQAHGLTLEEVAMQIRFASLELPGGTVETAGGHVLVRVADRRLSGEEFADIVLRSTAGGAAIRLGDIATIHDGFADTDQAMYYDGRPAVEVTAYRVGQETPLNVSSAVREYAEKLQAELPENIAVEIWDDDSTRLQERIALLMKNAALGGVLVLFILGLFLEVRLAFWVALGLPISFFGTFLLLPGVDVSINMISLFAFIVTIGMVVDDAIIVGENAFHKLQEGKERMEAAIEGAREMAMPVTFAILTTMAAFAPLFFVPGVMGKIFKIMPMVVLLVLAFSLLESFFILPAHLAHSRGGGTSGWFWTQVDRPRRWMANRLEWFIADVYHPVLTAVLRYRYITVAIAGLTFFVSVGLVASGLLPFNFFPVIQGDVVTAYAKLPYGTPIERSVAVQRELERSAWAAIDEVASREIVQGMVSHVGEGPMSGRHGGATREAGSHLVAVELELLPLGERKISTAQVAAAWLEALPPIAGLDSLTLKANIGPGAGASVDVQLSHTDTAVLAEASTEMTELLRSFEQLSDVENGYAAGKPQLDFHLRDHARTLGLTGNDVARQLRSGFYGAEALREQRGRSEIKVMVRLPEAQRRSEYDLEELLLRTPAGGQVPLHYVAEFERGRAPTSIIREDGRRVVDVVADLAPGVESPREVLGVLQKQEFPRLMKKYPGLELDFVGSQRAQSETFESLGKNYIIALLAIYALIAVPFRSYTQPLIIMSAIPFGFVGAVIGHVLMGYSMSLMSLFGVVALSGVVVNDSLVLIDQTNRIRANGADACDAIRGGASRRLRPILLTSLTTFFGLMPMIFETSVQARFLIPMAISLGYGILFATFIVLLIVPALYMILEDVYEVAEGVGAWWGRQTGEPVPTGARPQL
ncbi:MAG: efflux RND transporter permease subunit [Deltaproteobacteria bacterium]|nr:efflux RND transporter permease subunit [Deltaproteobacteria bacterium]